ncbi:MAG: hypothetical protein ABR961_16235 [Thermoanaerobaculaceae bacterium]
MRRKNPPQRGPALPLTAMRVIEAELRQTFQVQHTILNYDPNTLALALGPESGVPNAWTAVLWASHALQAARYHLYLAHHDRCYYQQYRKPPDPLTGDAIATWFFTSFTLHAVAAENHAAISMLLLHKKPRPRRRNFGTSDVIQELRPVSPHQADRLARIRGHSGWGWISEFRRRWFHLDPYRVDELGLQWRVDFDRKFWSVDYQAGTRTLPVGSGDPAEVRVSAMLQFGRSAFNMFAWEFASYVTEVEDQIRDQWQKWDPFSAAVRLKRPRRRPIHFLRTP